MCVCRLKERNEKKIPQIYLAGKTLELSQLDNSNINLKILHFCSRVENSQFSLCKDPYICTLILSSTQEQVILGV